MVARLQQFLSRIRAFLRPDTLDRDFNEELESHLAMLVEDYVGHGMSPEQALQKARLDLGEREQLVEAHRAVRGIPLLDAILRDLRYGLGVSAPELLVHDDCDTDRSAVPQTAWKAARKNRGYPPFRGSDCPLRRGTPRWRATANGLSLRPTGGSERYESIELHVPLAQVPANRRDLCCGRRSIDVRVDSTGGSCMSC
jgi:hypothetical protein